MISFKRAPLKRLLLIGCEIFFREAAAAIAESPCIIEVDFMPKSLHDIGEKAMSARLQERIDSAFASRPPDARPDAVVLLYGLCNNGIRGLRAPAPIVIPRAHDCIAVLLGSRARYDEHFQANPGTFYRSPGWIERDGDPDANPASVTRRLGITHDYAALVAKYGKDNADYLMETMGDWLKNYRKLSLIDTGVGPVEEYRRISRDEARERNWLYEELAGDAGLIRRLLNGDWNEEDFLVVPPGKTIAASNDEDVIRVDADAC